MTAPADDRRKIAQVWRAGRLLAGKTQAQLARAIDIPQSSISKYETMSLEPSASDWLRFCQYVGIDAHKSLSLGYIDSKVKFKSKLYSESLFHLPVKYRRDFSLKIREFLPFKEAILETLGQEGWNAFTTSHKVDSDMFSVLDFQVSYELLLDLLDWSKNQGLDLLSGASTLSGNLSNHGILKDGLMGKADTLSLLKKLVEYQPFYQNAIKAELSTTENYATLSLNFTRNILDYFDSKSLMKFRDYKVSSMNQILSSNSPSFHGFKTTSTAHDLKLMTRL